MKNPILKHLSESDEVLKKIIYSFPLPEIDNTHDVFHDLMSCILEQQIHYRSTKRIFQKMLQLTDIERITLENFPIFEEKALPTAKLAIGKLETVERIIDFFTVNKIKT